MLAAWVVLLVLGVVFGGQVFSRVTEARGPMSYAASRGLQALESASSGGSTVLAVVDGVRPGDPAVRAGVTRAAAALREVGGVLRVDDAYSNPSPALRARDGSAALWS